MLFTSRLVLLCFSADLCQKKTKNSTCGVWEWRVVRGYGSVLSSTSSCLANTMESDTESRTHLLPVWTVNIFYGKYIRNLLKPTLWLSEWTNFITSIYLINSVIQAATYLLKVQQQIWVLCAIISNTVNAKAPWEPSRAHELWNWAYYLIRFSFSVKKCLNGFVKNECQIKITQY